MKILVPRLLTELPSGDVSAPTPQGLLDDFFNRPGIVVIGDPGMGKTTAFRGAAEHEPNAAYATVRQFLRTPTDQWRGSTLYLDALDETRARERDNARVIDRVVERLCELERPKFRIACRAAEWEEESDGFALRDASSDGVITLLRLECSHCKSSAEWVAGQQVSSIWLRNRSP